MKLLKTSFLISFALISSPALAADSYTYDCLPGSFQPANDDNVLFQCQNAGTLTLPIPNSGNFIVQDGSFIKHTQLTFNTSGAAFGTSGQVTLADHASLTLTTPKAALGNNPDPSEPLYAAVSFYLQKGGTLNINSGAQLIVEQYSVLQADGTLASDGADNASITLRDHGWLILTNPNTSDKLHWHLQGPVSIGIQGYADRLPDKLTSQFNEGTTLIINSPDSPLIAPGVANAGLLKIYQKQRLTASVLPKSTTIGLQSRLTYSGTQQAAVEHIQLPKDATIIDANNFSTLTLSGDIPTLNLSNIGGNNNLILLANNKTHYTHFSTTNYNAILTQAAHAPFTVHYTDNTIDLSHIMMLSQLPERQSSLQLDTTITSPLDFSKILSLPYFDVHSTTVPNDFTQYDPHGTIILNADQTVTQFSQTYAVKVLPGKVITWTSADTTPLYQETSDHTPVLSGAKGMVRLTAPDALWGVNDLTGLDAKDMTVIFGAAGAEKNTQTVTALPKSFAIGERTRVIYAPGHDAFHDGTDLVQAEFINGSLVLNEDVDFAASKPLSHVWEAKAGSGSIVLNAGRFSNAEQLIGGHIQIVANSPKSISVVLKNAKTVVLGGEKYHYEVVYVPTSGGLFDQFLTLSLGDAPTPVELGDLLNLAQPAIEAQARFDLSRLNDLLWHPARSTYEGLFTWAKAVGTFQKTGKLYDTDATPVTAYHQEAYAAGVNLGGQYRWSLSNRGQAVSLSATAEWLRGTRTLGETHYQEQRINAGLGLRVDGELSYGALSAQWSNIQDKIEADDFSRTQHAFEASAEAGLKLRFGARSSLTPFVQYNWTQFDKTWATSSQAQQHLQLGAYLTLPWMSRDGIIVTNRLGVSTLISLLANDSASFQATWKLRLSSADIDSHLGLELQTTAEYAPGANQRRGVEVTLGADYDF